MKNFSVLVADPPWTFGDSLPGPKRGASKHYSCLPVHEIQRFPLPDKLSENAVLFMWRVSSMVEEANAVVRAWGFTPKSELVWVKRKTTGFVSYTPEDYVQSMDEENLAFGMGRITRAAKEVCIIATRGKVPPPSHRGIRDVFFSPRGEHSAKPEEFYRIVHCLYPHAPKFELFARTRRPGWKQFGNELPRPRGTQDDSRVSRPASGSPLTREKSGAVLRGAPSR